MKPILEMLGLRPTGAPGGSDAEIAAVRLVTERLAGLEPMRARFLAVFAMVLARAARADLEVSDDERWVMAQILAEHTDLPNDQIDLLLDMVVYRNRLFGASDDYVATRQFKEIAGEHHRECILRCLFAVCAADDSISLVEEEEIRQIASELGFSHEQYTAARAEFRDKREVLRGLRRERRSDSS